MRSVRMRVASRGSARNAVDDRSHSRPEQSAGGSKFSPTGTSATRRPALAASAVARGAGPQRLEAPPCTKCKPGGGGGILLYSLIMLRSALTIVALLAAFERPASAYLDPGTGSMLLQVLLGGVAAVSVVAKLYWRRLTTAFAKLQRSKR